MGATFAITPTKQAFSLVELAVVLVILGLLAGGVLSGTSLIRAAELRSIATDYARYSTAVQSFREKYFALPGDMPNATDFWGKAGGTGADTTCFAATVASSIKTCNGDGDGHLYPYFFQNGIFNPTASSLAPEWFLSWQQLANAGLIEGSYTGHTTNAGNREATPGVNVPQGKISQSGYNFESIPNAGGVIAGFFNGNYEGFLVGKKSTFIETTGPIFKPEEAWNIDTKLDDGKPGMGTVRTLSNNVGNCVSTTVNSTAVYVLTKSDIACQLFLNFSDPGV